MPSMSFGWVEREGRIREGVWGGNKTQNHVQEFAREWSEHRFGQPVDDVISGQINAPAYG
jgi:hypothetical protein